MPVLLVALFGSAIFNSPFFKIGAGPVTVLNALIVVTCMTYAFSFIQTKRGKLKYRKPFYNDRYLWSFFIIGAIYVGFSYLGFFKEFASDAVLFNSSYIPRQAFYLFFIPLILLAAREEAGQRLVGLIGAHYRLLFVAVYGLYVLINHTVAIDVSCCFCLSVLLLMGRRRTRVVDLFFLLVVLFSPIDSGGEMTQMICRLCCLIVYVSRDASKLLKPMLYCSILVVLGCYVLPFLPLSLVGLDGNTSWRLQYWGDELSQLLSTFGIGVGYGTSYATEAFIGNAVSGPFAATAEYSAVERIYVVGCHNSFVSLAYRLGILGVGFLFLYILTCASKKREPLPSRCGFAVFAAVASVFIVCFNVGFENPMYFFLFAFGFSSLGLVTRGYSAKEIGG